MCVLQIDRVPKVSTFWGECEDDQNITLPAQYERMTKKGGRKGCLVVAGCGALCGISSMLYSLVVRETYVLPWLES